MSLEFWERMIIDLTGEHPLERTSKDILILQNAVHEWENNILSFGKTLSEVIQQLASNLNLKYETCMYVLDHVKTWPSFSKDRRECLKIIVEIMKSSGSFINYSGYELINSDTKKKVEKFVKMMGHISRRLIEKSGNFMWEIGKKYKRNYKKTFFIETEDPRTGSITEWDLFCSAFRNFIHVYGRRKTRYSWTPRVLSMLENIHKVQKDSIFCPY
jgi:hypothetical protein